MRVTVISPERAIYDGEATEVTAPAYDGLVGIRSGHAPFMTLLGEGELTVQADGADHRFRVRQGFLQVDGDVVRVVAEHATETSEE
jgi:F-type H+-transporting ATPase subunit epsilon